MKVSICLTIFFGAILIAAQDCFKECADVRDHCSKYHLGGCETDSVACFGECRAKACLRNGGDLFGYGEMCGCHSDCRNSHCQDGVCCKQKDSGTSHADQCCSNIYRPAADVGGYNYECD